MEQPDIATLIEKARDEIRKLSPPDSNTVPNQSNINGMIEHSVAFADNVLKRLVAHTVSKDLNELFDTHVDTRGEILINDGSTQYSLSLDIVPHDYMLDLGHFSNNDSVKERIVHLLNMVKVLYIPVKAHMVKWASDHDTTFEYNLQLDLNTTLFLNHETEKRIGIVLTKLHK